MLGSLPQSSGFRSRAYLNMDSKMAEIIYQAIFEDLKATLGNDFIGELVETYCVETSGLLEQLRQALDRNDPSAFQRAAHSIKSSSASLGAMAFSGQAKELEMIGKSGDLSGAGGKLVLLVETYPDVQDALRTLAGAD